MNAMLVLTETLFYGLFLTAKLLVKGLVALVIWLCNVIPLVVKTLA